MAPRFGLFPFLLAAALAAACSSSSSSPSPAQQPVPNAPPLLLADCDPIVPTACGYPFPSDVWTVPDSTTATGKHVYFGDGTLPKAMPAGTRPDKSAFATRDGFSAGAAFLAHLPGATITGLPDPDHIDASLAPDSPTVVIEADTGTRVAHFAEIDATATDDSLRALIIHPAARLKDATRYIVAVRSVVDASGQPIPPSPVFQALRDGTPNSDLSVAPRRALYADVFSKLGTAGVDKSKLQIAWDFTTASKDNTTKWLVAMRDDALAKVGPGGPAYKITKVTDNPNPHIRRRIDGTFTVPLYLTQATPGDLQANPPQAPRLVLGSNGLPQQNGTADFPFEVQIPVSLVTAGKAGPIIQNGHGLFGSLQEGQDSYMADICDREGYVEIAVALEGMAADDVNFVTQVVGGDLGQFESVVERMHQGFLDELLGMRMMMGKFASDPAVTFNGKSVIDTTTRFYRGDSQGGISGGVYMAVTTDVTRGLLGEPGAPYELLLNRSVDFGGFFFLLRSVYPASLDIQLGLDIIDNLWDRSEPDGYIPYISADTLPNTPAHEVLVHVAIGDHQVTPLGAHFIARTVGAKNLDTVNREVWGVPDTAPGFTGNGMVEWTFPGEPAAPTTNTPPSDGADPHDALRKLPEAQDMADQFFRTGVVNQTCAGGGPCAAPANWAGM
jgi:hypothetical protein